MKKLNLFLVLFSLILASSLYAEPGTVRKERLPEIPSLSSRDEIFKEYSAIVDENYQLLSSGKEPLMLFFKYTVPPSENLLSIAARSNIPYDTIATLNGISGNSEKLTGKELLLPTVPGLFIDTKGRGNLQSILNSSKIENLQKENLCYNIGTETFVFLKNERFSPTERAYFLDATLGLPVDASLSYISSGFGMRKNPFSGKWKNHKGVDFAAAEGTPVRAVKNGTVSFAKKNDTTFGNYIILKHEDNSMTSVYAHMSRLAAFEGDTVRRGDIIGYVGSTGMATGPHLHFEIRFGGVAEDPEKLLPVKSSNAGF